MQDQSGRGISNMASCRDLEIIAPAAGAHDRVGQRGLIDAVLDHGLVDVDGDDLAERQPGLTFLPSAPCN